jgi:hypothetical protein
MGWDTRFLAFFESIFRLIDMRSFSSVWFWVIIAVYWSAASQTLLGAPYDLILRARRDDNPQDRADLHALVGIYVRRKLTLMRRIGHWIIGFNLGVMTLIFVLAFRYQIEFAQALFLLVLPIALVRLLGLRLAFRIEREALRDLALCRALIRYRLWVQGLGVVAIFATALWGMRLVITRSVLGF